MKMSPLQFCLDCSNWETDGESRFDNRSMAKKAKVRHLQGRTKSPRLEVMEQRLRSSGRRMGRCGICMEMSAAYSIHDTWKDSRATGVRPICLCRVLTLDT